MYRLYENLFVEDVEDITYIFVDRMKNTIDVNFYNNRNNISIPKFNDDAPASNLLVSIFAFNSLKDGAYIYDSYYINPRQILYLHYQLLSENIYGCTIKFSNNEVLVLKISSNNIKVLNLFEDKNSHYLSE